MFINGRIVHPFLVTWLRQSKFNAEIRRWRSADGMERDRPLSRWERAEEILRLYAVNDFDHIKAYVESMQKEEQRLDRTLIAAVPMTADESRETRRKANATRQQRWRERKRQGEQAFAHQVMVADQMRIPQRLAPHERDADGNTPSMRRIRQAIAPETLPSPGLTAAEFARQVTAKPSAAIDVRGPELTAGERHAASVARVAALTPAILALKAKLDARRPVDPAAVADVVTSPAVDAAAREPIADPEF
jgi:hypothetical protein